LLLIPGRQDGQASLRSVDARSIAGPLPHQTIDADRTVNGEYVPLGKYQIPELKPRRNEPTGMSTYLSLPPRLTHDIVIVAPQFALGRKT
ncbi:MAG: hypothetical protein WBW88_20360, partial [Rhodothermales bacterium]